MAIQPRIYAQGKPLFLEPGRQPPNEEWLSPKKVERGIYEHLKSDLVGICGIEECRMFGGYYGTPMCEEHAWQAWAVLNSVAEEAARRKLALEEYEAWEERRIAKLREEEAQRAATWKPERWISPGWVYYLLVGDLVKIGYTIDLEQRMKQYPPHSHLLAVHPGTLKMEREMHHKFLLHLSKGREWFTPNQALMDHIKEAREKFPRKELADLEVVKNLAA